MARSWRWRTRLLACCCLAAPTLSVLHAPAANAVEMGSLSAQISSSWQANATVWGMAYAHGDVYLVGNFTSLRPPRDPAGTGEHPATYFAALKASTGALDPAVATHTFTGQPAGTLPLINGVVAASPNGKTIYVGGGFTQVDGHAHSHIAAFNAVTGALLPWPASVSGRVSAIATSGSVVYVGGKFAAVDGSSRANLAAVSASNGGLVSWGGGTQPSTNLEVHNLAVTANGSQVVAAGYFDQVDGRTHSADSKTPYNKAVIIGGIGSGSAGALEPMPADKVVPVGTPAHHPTACISNVKDVVISGGVAYFANEGSGIDCFDGTWAAKLSNGSLKWVNHCLGATQSLAVVGNYLYKGSHVHDCQTGNANGDPDNFPELPTGHNRHVNSEQLSNGYFGPWYPNMNAGADLGPRAMATDGAQLYVGGGFTRVNGIRQQGIARFTSSTDYATPKPAAPTVTSTKTGTVTITAKAPVDLDDPDLVMELYRDGGKHPVATAHVHSLFWHAPTVRWVEHGLPSNSHPSYQVRAAERFGSQHSRRSAARKVTVDCAAPSKVKVRAAIVKVHIRGRAGKPRQVRIKVCSTGAVRVKYKVLRGHHVLARKHEHYLRAGDHLVALAIKNNVSRGHIRARVVFTRASRRRVVDRGLYLPRFRH